MISDNLLDEFYKEYKEYDQYKNFYDINSKKYRESYLNEFCDFFKLRDIICKISVKFIYIINILFYFIYFFIFLFS
jgi:hypothetical protein